jgi:hypothetical protein
VTPPPSPHPDPAPSDRARAADAAQDGCLLAPVALALAGAVGAP